jgi:two-component system chemotaxis response regulator CheY
VKKLRVLIVDDSTVMRKIFRRSLLQAGFDFAEVFEARNGVEALARVRKGNLDLILSDINIPSMDGIEFLRALAELEEGKGVPVVMLTIDDGRMLRN